MANLLSPVVALEGGVVVVGVDVVVARGEGLVGVGGIFVFAEVPTLHAAADDANPVIQRFANACWVRSSRNYPRGVLLKLGNLSRVDSTVVRSRIMYERVWRMWLVLFADRDGRLPDGAKDASFVVGAAVCKDPTPAPTIASGIRSSFRAPRSADTSRTSSVRKSPSLVLL